MMAKKRKSVTRGTLRLTPKGYLASLGATPYRIAWVPIIKTPVRVDRPDGTPTVEAATLSPQE